jgi:hypothetical protein
MTLQIPTKSLLPTVEQVPKPSIFERYAGSLSGDPSCIMLDDEALSLGLPVECADKRQLIDSINSFKETSDQHRKGDPIKGFGFAIACLKIARGEREPQIITDGVDKIVRPTILHKEHDMPFWKGFQLIFPSTLQAQGFEGVENVPSIEAFLGNSDAFELAAGYEKKIEAWSMKLVVEQVPVMRLYATDPNNHIVITIRDLVPRC